MNGNVLNQNTNIGAIDPKAVLKVTALCYLEDALKTEAYEDCKELIEKAKAFGATKKEVKTVLIKYGLGIRAARKEDVADDFQGGRLRL